MLKDKTAELPWLAPAALAQRPFELWLDGLLAAGLIEGQLEVRVGPHAHQVAGARPGVAAALHIRRPYRLLWRALTGGDLGFGRAYVAGDWDTPDLRALMYLLAVNEPAFAKHEEGSWLHRLLDRLRHGQRANSRTGSRRNIAFHYDLGNDFYQLWLDPSMTYSCALFEEETDGLEEAQANKYRRLIELIAARPGDHILEIGCGWGSFAVAAAAAGHQVTGITLSKAQLAWAEHQAWARGHAGRIELRLQDYRDLQGTYDHIVSIEMFEAVGERYWDQYMQTLRRRLRPGGRAALQVITIDEPTFAAYRRRPDFVQRHIFPGGMLPTPERFARAAAASGLRVTAQAFFGQDYARTLAIWHQRFLDRLEAVRALGFDERFVRMWRYYLAYCEAGFRDGRIDLMQVRLEHAAS